MTEVSAEHVLLAFGVTKCCGVTGGSFKSESFAEVQQFEIDLHQEKERTRPAITE